MELIEIPPCQPEVVACIGYCRDAIRESIVLLPFRILPVGCGPKAARYQNQKAERISSMGSG
jgi:hypothetical protein